MFDIFDGSLMFRAKPVERRLPQLRRPPLEVVRLNVAERDAVKLRRTSIILQQTYIMDGISVFEQIVRHLPFDQWDELKMQRQGTLEEESFTTLYANKLQNAPSSEDMERCRKLLDVERKHEIFTRASRGYELLLLKMSRKAQQSLFVREQTRLWFED